MMNGQQHWFAEGGMPSAGSQPGGSSGLDGAAAAAPAAAHARVGDPVDGALAPLNRSTPAGAQQGGGSGEPEAKRPRLSACEGPGSAGQLPLLDRAALTAWLAARGGATAPQLVAHFCRGCGAAAAGQAQQQQQQREAALVGLLGELCEEFEIMRKGGNSGFSAAIDLADNEVMYLVI